MEIGVITQERLKELFDYDQATGILFRKNTAIVAGSKYAGGQVIRVNRKLYRRTKLVWAMHYGEWPEFYVMRRNKDLFDDRIENLKQPFGCKRLGNLEGQEIPYGVLDEVRKKISYCGETGEFAWKVSVGKVVAGQPAGSIDHNGYVTLNVNGSRILGHRYAWWYVTGSWPSGVIDHKDTNPRNNKFSNLRAATRKQNQANMGAVRSSTGVKGVYAARKRFDAKIMRGGKAVYLGRFGTIGEAEEVRRRYAERVDGEFVNHGQETPSGRVSVRRAE